MNGTELKQISKKSLIDSVLRIEQPICVVDELVNIDSFKKKYAIVVPKLFLYSQTNTYLDAVIGTVDEIDTDNLHTYFTPVVDANKTFDDLDIYKSHHKFSKKIFQRQNNIWPKLLTTNSEYEFKVEEPYVLASELNLTNLKFLKDLI